MIAENPDVVERIRAATPKAMGALVGPIMRETKGRADGGEVNRLLRSRSVSDLGVWKTPLEPAPRLAERLGLNAG